MAITAGTTAYAGEVKPQLYTYMRNLVTLDKESIMSRQPYSNNFIFDGFNTALRISSSTNWTPTTSTAFSRPILYWTTTNGAELISKSFTFPSTKSFGTGYADYVICETIDECNAGAGAINTGIWDVVTDTDDSTQTYDGSGILNIVSGDDDSQNLAESTVRTDNAVLDSAHKYMAVKFSFAANNSGGSGTADTNNVTFLLDDGSNTATLWYITSSGQFSTDGVSTTSTSFNNQYWNLNYRATHMSTGVGEASQVNVNLNNSNNLLEVFYDPDSELCEVFINGLYYNTVNVSSVGNLKFTAKVESRRTRSSGGGCSSSTALYIDWIRREKASPSSSLAFNISANNGSNYTSVGHESETAIANTGTQGKVKLTATISGSEYIHVRGYSAFLR